MEVKLKMRSISKTRSRSPILFTLSAALLTALCVAASDSDDEEKKADTAEKVAPQKKAPDRAELEKKLQETLTNVTLVGSWRLVKDGKLGEEHRERYTISSVTRLGEIWLITARIQYGDRDVTVPVPVRIEWAGDTPIISVTDAGIPGVGTYTARVMIYRGLYSGTWFGKGYGGLMSGTITKNSDE